MSSIDDTNKKYEYIGLINTISPDGGPIFMNAMNQAII
jgi:hypothetical protein